eukprot:3872427-Pleurochrysis_carterae.AAC.1
MHLLCLRQRLSSPSASRAQRLRRVRRCSRRCRSACRGCWALGSPLRPKRCSSSGGRGTSTALTARGRRCAALPRRR